MTHNIAGAALTVLVGSTATSQSAMKGSHACPTEFLSLRDDGTIAVYCHAQDKMRDVRLSEACLCKYTNLSIQKGLSDMRTYVFRYEALKFILNANASLLDIQKHLVPYMVRYQLVSNQPSTSTRVLDRTSSTNLTLSGSSSNARLASVLGSSEETTGYDVVAYTAPQGSHCIRVCSAGSYADANRDVVSPDLASSYLEDSPNARGDAFIATEVVLGNKVTIAGGSMVGKGSVLGDRCSIKRSVVGQCCTVGPGSKIINSVIQDGVFLGDGCHIQNSIICSGSKLSSKVALKDCLVGTSAVVEAGDYKSEEIFQD
jgi:translation initiation factor eIF-2B subunit gamma